MKEHKTVENKFIWVPPDKRMSRFGGSVQQRKSETRLPILWLTREGNELYLVNSSGSTLDLVIVDGGGFQTIDDDLIQVNNSEKYEYTNVKTNTAVLNVNHFVRFATITLSGFSLLLHLSEYRSHT